MLHQVSDQDYQVTLRSPPAGGQDHLPSKLQVFYSFFLLQNDHNRFIRQEAKIAPVVTFAGRRRASIISMEMPTFKDNISGLQKHLQK